MKRKNVMPTSATEEESSEEEQLTDSDWEMVGEEEESVVDSEEEEGDATDDEDLDEDDDDTDDEDEEALDASATDSDEDESDIEDNEEEVEPPKSKSEIVKEQILQRYEERQGKQLFIRFPHKVPETQEALEEKVKELTPLVVKVHKPRQRHVRFCLVDFATNEDRNTALKELKKSIKKGSLDAVKIPRTENSEFVNELAERKLKSLENKKAKQRLKKASRKALRENNFTSTIIVLNLPKTASALQIREIFPNAVDINIKPSKGKLYKDTSIAAITLPSTLDARNAIKKKISLEGNQLIVRFDNQKLRKKNKNMKSNKTAESKPTTDTNETKIAEESEPSVKKTKLDANTTELTKAETLTRKGPVNKNNKNQNNKVNNKNNAKNKLKKVTK